MDNNRSPYLDLPGAVPNASGDRAWHFGQPLKEQRQALEDGAILDRSNRHIVTVTGDARLTWLHSLMTQHIEKLPEHTGTEVMVLSPTGRIEHHAGLYDDGTTTWLDVAPDSVEPFLTFLQMMKFRTEVDIVDVSDQYALVTYTRGRRDLDLAAPSGQDVPPAKFASKDLLAETTQRYPGTATETGWARRTDHLVEQTTDVLVPRSAMPDDQPIAGTWTEDALRVAAGRPVFGVDTDHKTVPHEVGAWLDAAVHLDKGCYRGQETVSRVHHLGKPPRRLVKLHLDGSDENPPEPGTPVFAGEKQVGTIGTAVQHVDEGQIALALLKRNVVERSDVTYKVGDQSASAETDL
ncbi:YgfZ/GcvT domain-containing protein [Haloglycomyces albus]|uniref:CAF17-like 4Fe-4S cluster assembly/insertion protein YgfZ n=1 Tax=Haloglycomyces albus TaxID=526067 RepID=UPI0004A4D177|nr:folate-binding protein YgfZ [Haloglycomyces albus]